MRISKKIIILAVALSTGCRTGQNYPTSASPRYTGRPDACAQASESAEFLRVVSFNVKYALQVDRAIEVLESEPALAGADLVLLQEMDEPGTRRIADALNMCYVYYPAVFHVRHRHDFGNAVLSRWPIVEDRKIVLPHLGRFARTQRIATAATVRVGQSQVRVYSTHLATVMEAGPEARRDQLRAILEDAAQYPRVIVGGDMNNGSVGRVARELGYAWPTERGPRTAIVGRLDHIFLKGFSTPDSAATGTVLDARGASDHRPIWVRAILGSPAQN